MFGHLASLIYRPTPNGVYFSLIADFLNLKVILILNDHQFHLQLLTKYVKDTYPNLGQFIERVKEKLVYSSACELS